MQEVPKVVGQIAVDAANQGITAEVTVLTEVDFAEQEVADSIGTELVNEANGVNDIALGLTHLVAVHNQPAMAVNLFRQRQVEGHEDAGPYDGMETHDFLAHEVQISRPVLVEFFLVIKEANRRQVVGQRIEPHIDNVLFVDGHRNAPVKGRTGNAQIFQSLLDKVNHLIAAGHRLNEIRMFGRPQSGQQPFSSS